MNNKKYIQVTENLCPRISKIKSIRTLKVFSQLLKHFIQDEENNCALNNVYVPQHQIVSETKLDKGAVSRAVKELKEVGLVDKYVAGCIVLSSEVFSKPSI